MKKEEDYIYEYLIDLMNHPEKINSDEFKKWLNAKEEHKQLYLDFLTMREYLSMKNMTHEPDIDKEWNTICQKLHIRKSRPINLIWRYAAVITIFIICTVTATILLNQTSQKTIMTLTPVADSEVTLTTATGNIELKDNIQLEEGLRNENNELIYSGSGKQDDNIEMHTLKVPRGKTFWLTMSDGTRIYMNAESELRYPSRFNEKSRQIWLKGEAYLEVKKMPNHPFIVHAGKYEVEVLGTHFAVSNYENEEWQTTLAEGKIKVKAGTQEKLLDPDMQAVIKNNEIEIKHVDAQQCIAWVNGLYIFENKTFEEVMNRLSRIYGIDVTFDDESVKGRRITGIIDSHDDIAYALNLLGRILNIKTENVNGTIQVKRINKVSE